MDQRLIEVMSLHPFRKFATELLLMLEEFRLTDLITKERPGTANAFTIRQEAYLAFHQDRLTSNMQKNFLADALIESAIYFSLRRYVCQIRQSIGGRSTTDSFNPYYSKLTMQKVQKKIRISLIELLRSLRDL